MGSRFGSIKRANLIARLKRLGFEGPFPVASTSSWFEERSVRSYRILTQARSGKSLLARILQQAGVTREEWEGSA